MNETQPNPGCCWVSYRQPTKLMEEISGALGLPLGRNIALSQVTRGGGEQ